jgi:Zn finger protein HypA/HybF involved in hydrogenase expression
MSEKKMTIDCGTCGDQYGRWRPRCPACGTQTPASAFDRAAELLKPPRESRAKRERERKPHECILCRKRVKANKKGTSCPHCNEPIHVACLELHRNACLQFQFEREAVLKAGTKK